MMAEADDAANALRKCKNNIKKAGIATANLDTLKKRGIDADHVLSPSSDKDLKKIKYYSRMNQEVKDEFLSFLGKEFDELVTFSKQGYDGNGDKWDKLLSDYIKSVVASEPSVSEDSDSSSASYESSNPNEESNRIKVAKELIDSLEEKCKVKFLESKFALFSFMRERAAAKLPALYLWRGEADAIAHSKTLGKYIIVEFKVVSDLLDYWKKKTELCGQHLHQCLAYAKLLQVHMNLDYLPPSLIVVIDQSSGINGFFFFFTNYPRKCEDKLDEYEWFTEQPSQRPFKMVKTNELFHEDIVDSVVESGEVPLDTQLNKIFKESATVRDLLQALPLYDSLKIVETEYVAHLDE